MRSADDGSIVAQISTGEYGGTIRIGEPYTDPAPAEDPDDTLHDPTYGTVADIASLWSAAITADVAVQAELRKGATS